MDNGSSNSNDQNNEKNAKNGHKEEYEDKDLHDSEKNLEDIYEKKKKERMMEEERGRDERKRLEELMKLMEGDIEKVEYTNDEFNKQNQNEHRTAGKNISKIRDGEGGVLVDDEARVIEPAPATLSDKGASDFNTYLTALSDFNEKFNKFQENSYTHDNDNLNKKKHFDEKSYVISSNQSSQISYQTSYGDPYESTAKQGDGAYKKEDSDGDEDVVASSPIPDSGVEFCSPDWVQFSQPFQKTPEKKLTPVKKTPHSSYHDPSSQPSTPSRPPSLHHRHYHLSTPRIIQSSSRSSFENGRHLSSYSNPHLLSTKQSSLRPYKYLPMNDARMTRFGSDSKILRSERWDESQQELQILHELQRDVLLNIEQLQRDITQTEAQQSDSLRELEVERALLAGEKRLVMTEVEALKERLKTHDEKVKLLSNKNHKNKPQDHKEIKTEKAKLKELEGRRKALESKLKQEKKKEEEGEAGSLERRWRDAKEEEDAQRTTLENLEFQLLEGESKEEDEREEEEGKLVQEKDSLLDLVASKQLQLEEMATHESEMVRQVERDGEELAERVKLLTQQLEKERSILDNINQQADLLTSFSSAINPNKTSHHGLNRRNESWSKSASPHHHSSLHQQYHTPSLRYPYQKRTASQTLPLFDSYKYPSLQRDRIAFMKTFEERSYRYHLKPKTSSFSPTSNPSLYPPEWSKHTPKRNLSQKASSWLAVNSESEETLSDSESEKDASEWSKIEAMEKIRDMECQLLIAKAEKLKLIEKQKKELENMQGEIRRRRGESVDGRGDRILRRETTENDANSRASNGASVSAQSRPLTRYLPTPDRQLDLVTFIASCGHNVHQCRNVILTASSCRGYLNKMTGCHIRKWKKRWFVFDRSKRSLSYYADNRENKPKTIIYFQSIEDVFVDHLHQVSSPTPQLTFCLKTLQRAFFLLAPSADAMRVWIDVLTTGAEAHHRFA